MKLIKKLTIGLFLLGTMLSTQNINAQSLTNTVTVAWDAVNAYVSGSLFTTNDIAKYNLYRATLADLSDKIKVNSTTVTNLNYVDSGFVTNKTYYYYLTAYIIPGLESDPSDVVSFKTIKPSKSVIRITTN